MMMPDIFTILLWCILCYLIGHIVGYERCYKHITQHSSFNKNFKYSEAPNTQTRPDGANVEQPSNEKI